METKQEKKYLGKNVLDAAFERVEYVFDNFKRIYVSFSGGKDSTCMLHIVMQVAIRRGVRVGVLFVDLEAQYKMTIDHIQEMMALYSNNIEPHWVCLPLNLRNAVSQYQPQWVCWDDGVDLVRDYPPGCISDKSFFPFFRHAMEFEEFVPEFGKWFGNGESTACFVGIRTGESLNRWRTIASDRKQNFNGRKWMTWCGGCLYNAYPIYDWTTSDDWTFLGKFRLPYNPLYDRMHQAGLSIHQMRICQPYGDDQRKGLWLFHIIEPETWGKVVARVNGANQGSLYAQETGNILGRIKIKLPSGHNWESFSKMLLASMPESSKEHFGNKISVFVKWWRDRGFQKIPDDGPDEKTHPSWKRICKAILRNDYWCKGLSFSQHKSKAYEKYKKLMKSRRAGGMYGF